MYIKKSYLAIMLGLILMFHSFGNIVRLTPILFEEGSAWMVYKLKQDVNLEEIRHIIQTHTAQEKKQIDVEVHQDDQLKIRLDYVDFQSLKALDVAIRKDYPEPLEMLSMNSTGEGSVSKKFIVILSMYYLVMISGLIFLLVGVISIVKEKSKKHLNQASHSEIKNP